MDNSGKAGVGDQPGRTFRTCLSDDSGWSTLKTSLILNGIPLQDQQQYNRSRSFEGPRSPPPSHGSHHFGGSLSPLGMTCLSE